MSTDTVPFLREICKIYYEEVIEMTLLITIIISLISAALVLLWCYKEAEFLGEADEKFDKVMYEITMKKKYGKHL